MLPYVAIAVIVAVAIWSMQQRAIEDSTPVETRFAPEARHVEPSGPSKAKGDLRTLFSANDYPVSALRAGEEGTVEAQLAIDESGRVRDCTIVRSSGSVSLDKATCDIVSASGSLSPRSGCGRKSGSGPSRNTANHVAPRRLRAASFSLSA